MAITLRIYFILSFIASLASLILLIVSLTTPNWIEATITYNSDETIPDDTKDVNYGLFSGTIIYLVLNKETTSTVKMVCLMGDNVCMMSCGTTTTTREEDLTTMYSHNNGTATDYCATQQSSSKSLYFQNEALFLTESSSAGVSADEFINAGLWVSTLTFISIALLFALVAAIFALVNVFTVPREPILGVWGLYIWNGITVGSTTLTMILWGSAYSSTIANNIAISDTLSHEWATSSCKLGYSFWLLLGTLFLSLIALGLVHYRKYRIDHPKDSPKPNPEEEQSDGIIFLY